MNITKVHPQGFCKGVINAIKMTNEVLLNKDLPRPIYMYGGLVHNQNVINTYSNKGIISIHSLDEVKEKGTLIITAHGVSKKTYKKIEELGVKIVDTTCDSVKEVQKLVYEKINDGYDVVYYGVKNHSECKSISEDYDEHLYVIQSKEEVDNLSFQNRKIFFTNQTTMSYLEAVEIINSLKKKFPYIEVEEDICNATRKRQLALISEARNNDLCLVVGDRNSNNTLSLVDICNTYTFKPCKLIEKAEDLRKIDFSKFKNIAVTSGASTPSVLVDQVIGAIKDPDNISSIQDDDYIKIQKD